MYWTCVWRIYSFHYLLMYCIIHHLLHLFVPCPSGTCSRVCKQVLCGELSCVSFLHCSQGFLTLPFSVERKRRFPYLHRRMSCKIRLEEVTWTETWGAGRVFGSTNCDIHTSKVNQRWDIISAPAWGFHQAKATWILLQVFPLSLDSWLSNCSYLLSTVPASSFILQFLACSVSCCQVQNDISSHLQLPQVSMDGLHQTLALLPKKKQIKINWSMPFRTSKGGDSESTVACAARMLCPSCCHLNLKQDRKTEIYMKYVALEPHQRKRAQDVSQASGFEKFEVHVCCQGWPLVGSPWHCGIHRQQLGPSWFEEPFKKICSFCSARMHSLDVNMSGTWKKRTASAIHAVVPDRQMAIEIIVSYIFTYYSYIALWKQQQLALQVMSVLWMSNHPT